MGLLQKPLYNVRGLFNYTVEIFYNFILGELRTLKIVTKETSSQLVNYRQQGDLLMVDRLFQTAELRLGLSNPEIIQIKRIKR